MTSFTRDRLTLGIAVALPAAAVLWMLTAQTLAAPSTYVFVVLLVAALGVIGFNTWRNSQATASVAQVIHEADVTPVAATRPPADQTSASR